MQFKIQQALTAAAILGLAAWATAAQAATVVSVDLWDKGSSMAMPTNLAYPVSDAQHAAATMGVKLSTDHAPAGIVSFQVTNSSKDTIHEMVVAKLTDPGKPLPYDAKKSVVPEDKIAYIGEVEETDPGKTGTFTKALAPGEYILMCNIAGHFVAGMWTTFTVTK
jgi:uncharacterized cupredoxin-like copper-binding protein